jgi:hypothetical protein
MDLVTALKHDAGQSRGISGAGVPGSRVDRDWKGSVVMSGEMLSVIDQIAQSEAVWRRSFGSMNDLQSSK